MDSPIADFVTFFACATRYYVPVILFAALLHAHARSRSRRVTCALALTILVGLIAAPIASHTTLALGYFTEFNALLAGGLLASALLAMAAVCFAAGAWSWCSAYLGLPFLALATTEATKGFGLFIGDQSLNVTTVVNSSLIINAGALLLGATTVLTLSLLLARCLGRLAPATSRALFVTMLLLFAVPWSATLLISLIRLQLAPTTGGTLAYVAKVQHAAPMLTYAVLVVWALILALFARQRQCGPPDGATPEPERRKLRRAMIVDRRHLGVGMGLLILVAGMQAGYDLVVDQPPALSQATPVTPDADGQISIPIAEVADGHLHRYAYITSDGHRVRFFLIQRYEDSSKFGVAFDACQICGDMGYLETGRNVICLACNVSIFTPSIGKAGGCNPIPLDHVQTDTGFLIAATSLEAGAKDDIRATYRMIFGWRTSIFAVLLLIGLIAVLIFAIDQLSGLWSGDRREIALLRAIGWPATMVLRAKLYEVATVILLAYLLGVILAWIHIFACDGGLLARALRGWSVIFPRAGLVPAVKPGSFALLFALTAVPLLTVALVPIWRIAATDPERHLRQA